MPHSKLISCILSAARILYFFILSRSWPFSDLYCTYYSVNEHIVSVLKVMVVLLALAFITDIGLIFMWAIKAFHWAPSTSGIRDQEYQPEEHKLKEAHVRWSIENFYSVNDHGRFAFYRFEIALAVCTCVVVEKGRERICK